MPQNKKKRNHYIPKLLLKRFASQTMGKSTLVWLLSRERGPVEVSVRDAGVSSYFYGDPSNGLEDRLSGVESIQAQTLKRIEDGDDPSAHAETLRGLVWTLTIRTNALRSQFTSATARLVGHLADSAGDDDAKAAFAARVEDDLDELLPAELAKLPPRYRDRALQLLEDPDRRHALRDRFRDTLLQTDLQALMHEAFSTIDGVISRSVQDGQIRGLTSMLDRGSAPERFAPAHWRVERRQAGAFVLGDGCVFAVDGDGKAGTLLASSGAWGSIYLPVSSSAVLIASSDPIESVLTDDEINAASVALSAECFFSSLCGAREHQLIERIGSRASLMSDEEMARLAKESWTKAPKGGQPKARP